VNVPSQGAFFVIWGDRNEGKTYSTHALCHTTTACTPSRAFSFTFPRQEKDYFGYLVKQLGLPKKTSATALSQVVTNALLADDDLVNDAISKMQNAALGLLSKMRYPEEPLDALGVDTFKSEDDLPFPRYQFQGGALHECIHVLPGETHTRCSISQHGESRDRQPVVQILWPSDGQCGRDAPLGRICHHQRKSCLHSCS
jgi:hypothetical protein